jgi:hypothetical protein
MVLLHSPYNASTARAVLLIAAAPGVAVSRSYDIDNNGWRFVVRGCVWHFAFGTTRHWTIHCSAHLPAVLTLRRVAMTQIFVQVLLPPLTLRAAFSCRTDGTGSCRRLLPSRAARRGVLRAFCRSDTARWRVWL